MNETELDYNEKGLGRLVYGAAKRLYRCGAKDRGFESRSGGRFLSTESTCVLTLDGVPLTPMSSHCWHVKEPYHSARVQVMGSGRPTQSQERKQYVCAFLGCLSVSLTQVRHSPRSELAPQGVR